jgi:hypothetical protein
VAKHPKPENARNPLRQLRELLSEKGPERPITQERLSEIIGKPTSTIRAIEAGARQLTDDFLRGVLVRTGAVWDRENEEWVVFDSLPPREGFSLAAYKEFERHAMRRPKDYAERVWSLFGEMSEMSTMVPDSRWWDLYFRFVQSLEKCRKEFQLPELERIYSSVPSAEGKDLAEATRRFLSSYQEQLSVKGHQKKGWKRLSVPKASGSQPRR